MELNINLGILKKTFNIEENTPGYFTFSGHKSSLKLKLFPFDTHPGSAEVVKNLCNVTGGFIRLIQKENIPPLTYDKFISSLKDKMKFQDSKDIPLFENMIKNLFFDDRNKIKPFNIGTYKFIECNTKEEKIAAYLKDTLCNGYDVKIKLEEAIKSEKYNVLEKFIMSFITSSRILRDDKNYYKIITTQMQEIFYEDFCYMLNNSIFAKEYLTDFLEHYYFYYTSQSCMLLNRFFDGDRNIPLKLYYSIDWENTSKSRLCYENGWLKLQKYLLTLFSHAVVLEIINQNDGMDKLDYIDLNNIIVKNPDLDEQYASQIMKAAELYRSCIHDCDAALESVNLREGTQTKTEQAVRYLFDSVMIQFENSPTRSRANRAYTEKFELFCKTRILKNRRSMGLMLNLTERDLLFLTKLCLKDKERMKLNDIFIAFEKRGIYLDNPSKKVVMNYYEKLNLIEKKSDSGDAQYVKGIL